MLTTLENSLIVFHAEPRRQRSWPASSALGAIIDRVTFLFLFEQGRFD